MTATHIDYKPFTFTKCTCLIGFSTYRWTKKKKTSSRRTATFKNVRT